MSNFAFIIPCFNYGSLVSRAIASVLPQLTDEDELLVIDDGSTDDTPEILAELHRVFPDKWRSIRTANSGSAATRNRGISETRADFLVFLDADDELVPTARLKFAEHIQNHPSTCMVIGGHWAVKPNGERRVQLPGKLPTDATLRLRAYLLEKRLNLANGSCAMHRSVFDRGLYPEKFRCVEDIPVFAQAIANYPCSVLNEPIGIVHKHDDSLRHQHGLALDVGMQLVDEVFHPARQTEEMEHLRAAYFIQRALSLFRTLHVAGQHADALTYWRLAKANDWRVVFRSDYVFKALRSWWRAQFPATSKKLRGE